MKRFNKIILFVSAIILFNSCKESWLDINVDPSNPTNVVAPVQNRLPWMQHHLLYAHAAAGVRSALITQNLTFIKNTSQQSMSAGWDPIQGMSTTPYQFFFVAVGSNLADFEKAAEAQGAFHYLGAAKVIRAMGFMLMVDWLGEIPYTEALGENISPKFDDGKTIFEGCIKDIDQAIAYFEMTQTAGATPLSAGDSWNGGDVDKWKRLAYGLKARWLNNLSKKSIYNPDEILALLEKAPNSNATSTVVNHVDVVEPVGDVLFGDPLKASVMFSNMGMNTNFRITKWYEDILTNTSDPNVADPRADKMIPWAQFGSGSLQNKVFKRSKGVDMSSDIRMNGGPITSSFNNSASVLTLNAGTASERKILPYSNYIGGTNSARYGDTLYVSTRSNSIGYNKAANDQYVWGDGSSAGTSIFNARPDAPTYVMTYAEMCFIKAEIYFKKGNNTLAFEAYKAGIKAHIDMMNAKLTAYGNINPSKSPMSATAVTNFLENGIGAAGDLTLNKIMTQKYIAMSYSHQNWNDMRRYDYDSNVYSGWKVPYEYTVTASAQNKIPSGTHFRRVMQVNHEFNYNAENVKASHPRALSDDVWSQPVWWDIKE
ncbi:MAG: SusD/RagB family nutrient-binding outer membrane lipoprotein [Sphingobacterium composti]|uniref:SusD/RagB family nutrient-binding outer membrane lipoprotein n=1 Tax=Sphingobacterium composti TaxID=363260 RepID=UPI00135872D5|nr:SusD/RagB family nutrient-binding outer membrane lipoprotein [Sphingobacterium composti Ten et al. 2007 non Yoo et al. 2007]